MSEKWQPEFGVVYRTCADLPVLCCGGHIPEGTEIKVREQTSLNRYVIAVKEPYGDFRCCHRVKKGKLHRAIEEGL